MWVFGFGVTRGKRLSVLCFVDLVRGGKRVGMGVWGDGGISMGRKSKNWFREPL